MKVCGLIPSYNHFRALRGVIGGVRAHVADLVVVDDGSSDVVADELKRICEDTGATLLRRERNGGKGAAVKSGLAWANEQGFTHVIQVDADGQHDLSTVPTMLAHAEQSPDALILAEPLFDETAPKGRLWARRICIFWVDLETRGHVIHDPMCGYRVYPVKPALQSRTVGDRMDFDPEIAVRMVWAGAPVINVPARVNYPEDGLSNFQTFWDNVRLSWMHSRLMTRLIVSRVFSFLGF